MPIKTSAGSAKQPSVNSELETLIASLSDLALSDLRRLWTERFRASPPSIRSAGIMRQLLAWQLQEREFGGLDSSTERILAKYSGIAHQIDFYERRAPQLSPGVELAREWKGVLHKVIVNKEGFLHLGKQYASLSEVARFITGSRWSGPRFFGLERKNQRKTDGAP